jgi:1,4-alpha-glucan branching enzyme
VVAFRRWDRGGPGDDVVIVANFRHEPHQDYAIGFPAEGSWEVRFHSDWSGYSERFEDGEVHDVIAEPAECDGLPCRGAISIPPYTALILSQDRK